jgi:hypothetical protein
MKVLCTRLPVPVDGLELESSPWVSVGREYTVLAALAEFGGRVQLLLLTDDRRSFGWFGADCFLTVDSTIPPNWSAHVGEGGSLELAPRSWLADGFWERYYDGGPAARESVASELTIILGEASP